MTEGLLRDTDALSHLLRGTPRGGLVEKIAAVPPDRRFLSAITLGELLYGLQRSGLASLQRQLEREFLSHIEVLPFDGDAAREYARLRVALERQRTTLAEADLQIAAIALSRGLSLLTGNVKHFGRVEGLRIQRILRQGRG